MKYPAHLQILCCSMIILFSSYALDAQNCCILEHGTVAFSNNADPFEQCYESVYLYNDRGCPLEEVVITMNHVDLEVELVFMPPVAGPNFVITQLTSTKIVLSALPGLTFGHEPVLVVQWIPASGLTAFQQYPYIAEAVLAESTGTTTSCQTDLILRSGCRVNSDPCLFDSLLTQQEFLARITCEGNNRYAFEISFRLDIFPPSTTLCDLKADIFVDHTDDTYVDGLNISPPTFDPAAPLYYTVQGSFCTDRLQIEKFTLTIDCPYYPLCSIEYSDFALPFCGNALRFDTVCQGATGTYVTLDCNMWANPPGAVTWEYLPDPTGVNPSGTWYQFQNSTGSNACAPAYIQFPNGEGVWVRATTDVDCPNSGQEIIWIAPCKNLSCTPVDDPVNGIEQHVEICMQSTDQPLQTGPFVLNVGFSGSGINCAADDITWYRRMPSGVYQAVAQGYSYQPDPIFYDDPSATLNDLCCTVYEYEARVNRFVCPGCDPVPFSITVFVHDIPEPNGILDLIAPEVFPLCPGEDVALAFEKSCADPEEWRWYILSDPPAFPVPSSGLANPALNSGKIWGPRTYQVYVKNGACPEDIIDIIIPTKPLLQPTITAEPIDACTAQEVKLTAQLDPSYPLADLQFHWYLDGVLIATTADPFYTHTDPFGNPVHGNYWVVVKDVNCGYGGLSNAVSNIVTLDEPLELVLLKECYLCAGDHNDQATFEAKVNKTNCIFNWYHWDETEMQWVLLPGTGSIKSVNMIGTYKLEVECGDCFVKEKFAICHCGEDPCIPVTVSTNERFVNELVLDVFPNPVCGALTLVSEELLYKEVNAFLYDAFGRVQRHWNQKFESERIILEIGDINSGLYFLEVVSAHKRSVVQVSIIDQ